MAAVFQEFEELLTVEGLQDLWKADLLKVAKSLHLAYVNASYTKAKIAKLMAQGYYDKAAFTSEDLAQFVETDGELQPLQLWK